MISDWLNYLVQSFRGNVTFKSHTEWLLNKVPEVLSNAAAAGKLTSFIKQCHKLQSFGGKLTLENIVEKG